MLSNLGSDAPLKICEKIWYGLEYYYARAPVRASTHGSCACISQVKYGLQFQYPNPPNGRDQGAYTHTNAYVLESMCVFVLGNVCVYVLENTRVHVLE